MSGPQRQRLASELLGLDLHLHVQRRFVLHLHNGCIGHPLQFVLSGDRLSRRCKLARLWVVSDNEEQPSRSF
jgi:hypothetical protein